MGKAAHEVGKQELMSNDHKDNCSTGAQAKGADGTQAVLALTRNEGMPGSMSDLGSSKK